MSNIIIFETYHFVKRYYQIKISYAEENPQCDLREMSFGALRFSARNVLLLGGIVCREPQGKEKFSVANCSSCNGCSGRSCTRVGALGMLCRPGRPSYYTGPCPPAPCADGCGNCSRGCGRCAACGGCEGQRDPGGGYGIFTLSAPVQLSAGDAVEFTPCDVNPDGFSCRGDSIVLRRPGLYRAVLTADIPKFTDTDTVLSLRLNGEPIAAAEMALDTNNCSSATNSTFDAIFEANAGDRLRVCTSNALTVGCSGGNLLRLTLQRF